MKIMLSTNPPVSLLSEESLTTKERVSVTALFEKTEGRLAPTAGRYYLNDMQRFPVLVVALVTLAWTAEGRRTQEANPAAATAQVYAPAVTPAVNPAVPDPAAAFAAVLPPPTSKQQVYQPRCLMPGTGSNWQYTYFTKSQLDSN